jgi:hypothetical protein
MKTPEQRIAQARREIEAQHEWTNFTKAIHKSQPAIQTFTKEALMLLHLALGDKALAHVKEGK